MASLSMLAIAAMDPAPVSALLSGRARLVIQVARDLVDGGATTRAIAAAPPIDSLSFTLAKPRAVPRADQYRIPIGTVVAVRLRTSIDSSVNQVNDQVDAVLSEAVTQEGIELIPVGSVLHGTIRNVEAASREVPLGHVVVGFAVVQHAETGSRAPFPTQPVTIEAQPPAQPAGKRRDAKSQPIDVILPAGHPLQVTLSEPLVVAIPKAR